MPESTPIRCHYGCHRTATVLRREYYEAHGGGIICEANLICDVCAAQADAVYATLEARGLLK
jgi:hypothetical protein